MTNKYEVVFEAPLYYSVFIDADDADEAQDKAIDRGGMPLIVVPHGFDVDTNWFVSGVTRVRDDD